MLPLKKNTEPSFSAFSALVLYASIPVEILPEITFASEILPRNGSAIVLKTSAAILPLGSHLTVSPSVVSYSLPVAVGTYLTIDSSTSVILSPVTDEHSNTGTISPLAIPVERPFANCSSVSSIFSR